MPNEASYQSIISDRFGTSRYPGFVGGRVDPSTGNLQQGSYTKQLGVNLPDTAPGSSALSGVVSQQYDVPTISKGAMIRSFAPMAGMYAGSHYGSQISSALSGKGGAAAGSASAGTANTNAPIYEGGQAGSGVSSSLGDAASISADTGNSLYNAVGNQFGSEAGSAAGSEAGSAAGSATWDSGSLFSGYGSEAGAEGASEAASGAGSLSGSAAGSEAGSSAGSLSGGEAGSGGGLSSGAMGGLGAGIGTFIATGDVGKSVKSGAGYYIGSALGSYFGPIGSAIGGAVGSWVSSKCYLTTAVLQNEGKDDDAYELQILRWFRDKVMMATQEGQYLVQQYYQNAPLIVEAINSRPDAAAIYQAIKQYYINPAVACIEAGDFEEALKVYAAMSADMAKLAAQADPNPQERNQIMAFGQNAQMTANDPQAGAQMAAAAQGSPMPGNGGPMPGGMQQPGAQALTPQDLMQIASLVDNPELAQLLVKAFGPPFEEMLEQAGADFQGTDNELDEAGDNGSAPMQGSPAIQEQGPAGKGPMQAPQSALGNLFARKGQ